MQIKDSGCKDYKGGFFDTNQRFGRKIFKGGFFDTYQTNQRFVLTKYKASCIF